MKIKTSDLIITAGRPDQYPNTECKEVAFAGKSNVGKSSMINALLNRKNLARTSGSPGKTRTVNFYSVNNEELVIVDLPGYGFARVSKKEKAKWQKMIETYLHRRDQLREVILLVDIRHEPGDNDVTMYNWIKEFGFSGLVIATKADKISKGKISKHVKIIKNKLGIEEEGLILPFSAESKMNRDLILNMLEHME
ncbi:MAG: YihA family ribosome biogenesis GTP-binding protein [Tissierellales bacterium]|nr:YihA family ribosome biogenesis GTP-binding protein [Tissierellales bacterium]